MDRKKGGREKVDIKRHQGHAETEKGKKMALSYPIISVKQFVKQFF